MIVYAKCLDKQYVGSLAIQGEPVGRQSYDPSRYYYVDTFLWHAARSEYREGRRAHLERENSVVLKRVGL